MQRLQYLCRGFSTYMEASVLTWRLQYLRGGFSTYVEASVLMWRLQYLHEGFSTYVEASILTQRLQYSTHMLLDTLPTIPTHLYLHTLPTYLCLPTILTHLCLPAIPTHLCLPTILTHYAYSLCLPTMHLPCLCLPAPQARRAEGTNMILLGRNTVWVYVRAVVQVPPFCSTATPFFSFKKAHFLFLPGEPSCPP